MEQLRDVIARLLCLAGPQGVNRTVLTKLVYFSELESWRRYGRPLTGVSFYRYKYGAWAPDVQHVAETTPFIEHRKFLGFYFENVYRLAGDAPVLPLAEEDEDILRWTCETFSKMTAADIGRLSKETEPMVAAPEQAESLDLSLVAPRRSELTVRSSRLAQAQAGLDLTQRGSRQELDERDVVEMAAWANARRRAS
jgi:hypothetical protein